MPRLPHLLHCPLFLALCLCLAAGAARAAGPLAPTGYIDNPQAPGLSSQPRYSVPLPPQLPAFLPDGGANLDEAWIEDGGARLYWNTLLLPRQLKMAGATYIDPALTPQLLPQPATPPARRTWKRRTRPTAAKATAKAPDNAASLALKKPEAPAIPLPVTPDAPATPKTPEASAAPAAPAVTAKAAAPAQAVPAAKSPTQPVPVPPLQ